MADPYRQGEAEKLEALIAAGEPVTISEPIQWRGGLGNIVPTVRALQHRCGFPATRYQIKYNGDVDVLRLSDYVSRHACTPGEYFWLVGELIRGGDLDDYAADKAKLGQ